MIERLVKLIPEQSSKLLELIRHIFHVLLEDQRCHQLSVLIGATLLSVIAWSAEALAFHWVLQWMGADIPLTFSVFVYAISMLAGALNFMPGGLGGAEAVMVTMLVWKGMPNADAIAATVLIRLTTLWFAVIIGMLSLNSNDDN